MDPWGIAAIFGALALLVGVLFGAAVWLYGAGKDARNEVAVLQRALDARILDEWQRSAAALREQLKSEMALARARAAGAEDDFAAARAVGVALADGDAARRFERLLELFPDSSPAATTGAPAPAIPGEPLASPGQGHGEALGSGGPPPGDAHV